MRYDYDTGSEFSLVYKCVRLGEATRDNLLLGQPIRLLTFSKNEHVKISSCLLTIENAVSS